MKYALKINDKNYTVDVGDMVAGRIDVTVNGKTYQVAVESTAVGVPKDLPARVPFASTKVASSQMPTEPFSPPGSGVILAPIPGLITDVKVKTGDTVQAGQCVAVMEAMKMENQITTSVSGNVLEVNVQKGSEVATGQLIMKIG